jgi:hypothetical protein
MFEGVSDAEAGELVHARSVAIAGALQGMRPAAFDQKIVDAEIGACLHILAMAIAWKAGGERTAEIISGASLAGYTAMWDAIVANIEGG